MQVSATTSPFPVDATTPVCDRVDLLEELADAGSRDPRVLALAQHVREQADLRCQSLTEAALHDLRLSKALFSQNGCVRVLALEALRAAQSLPYVSGPSGVDQYQPAAWTLAHGGECKALVVLFVALCRALGLHAEPIWLTQTGEPINHVIARVWVDGQWLWADPSMRGAALGESPYEAVKRLGAYAIIGRVAPAGAVMRTSGLFPWNGWNTIWGGWPASWWCQYYPYLCVAPSVIASSAPEAIGFYPMGTHEPLSPAGCACMKTPISSWKTNPDREDHADEAPAGAVRRDRLMDEYMGVAQ